MSTTVAPTVVFTPPPTPNGPLHVGHVGGPYLRADLYVRLVRLVDDREIVHVSHVDTYQSYVAKKAAEVGAEPDGLAQEFTERIRADFAAYELAHDRFGDNRDPRYLRFLREGAAALTAAIPVVEREVPRCDGCGHSQLEAYARSACTGCLHDAYLNVCENCSLPQGVDGALGLRCTRCVGGEATGATVARFLELGADRVATVERTVRGRHGASRRAEALFSRLGPHLALWQFDSPYGIAVDDSGLVLNPWMEIFFHHTWCLMQECGVDVDQPFADAVAELNRHEPEVIYFFGVDNTYYYAFLFTALAQALRIVPMVPSRLKINHFMHLDGAKISSSRGNVVWADELVGTAPVDVLRTRLARSCPEYAPRELADPGQRPLSPQGPWGDDGGGGAGPRELDVVRERLLGLAAIDEFSVERLVDVLDKGRARAAVVGGADAAALDRYLADVCRELRLA